MTNLKVAYINPSFKREKTEMEKQFDKIDAYLKEWHEENPPTQDDSQEEENDDNCPICYACGREL